MPFIMEQHHDERGIVWPTEISPFVAHIIPVSVKDETQWRMAKELHDALKKRGIEALLDDRDERTGVKFHDADLIGIPVRIAVGRDVMHGRVECVDRGTPEKRLLSTDEAIRRIEAVQRKRMEI